MSRLLAFALAAATSAATTWLAGRWAERAGLRDDPASAPERKRQARPVPAVGGIAILAGLAASASLHGSAWIGVLLAFVLGTIDDRKRGGLPPLALLAGQAVVAAALVAGGFRIEGGPAVLATFAVVAALNAVNTFDNADGAATSLGVLGLGLGTAPVLAGPLAGFLPWNLLARRGSEPAAYLGNSGSLVLGVLLVLDPVARFALLLPLLDLLRLSFVRIAAGSRPWIGDRRHLAHRLEKAGLPRAAVALVLACLAAPAVIGAHLGGSALLPGVLATTVLAAAAVLCTPRAG